MLVLEDTVENKELFAAGVDVRRKMAVGSISNDRGGARDFVTEAVEHAAIDAGHRRRFPRDVRTVHGNAFGEIGIQFHGSILLHDPNFAGVNLLSRQLALRLA